MRRQRFCRDLFYRGQAGQTYIATHEATGLVVKVRPDLLIISPKTGRRVMVDFKTTSAPDYAHFVATIEQYDYDRQAALYSDLLGAARFIIIGVQKPRLKRLPQMPEVWQFEATAVPGLIEQGRKKYERLMKSFLQQQARVAGHHDAATVDHWALAGARSVVQPTGLPLKNKIITLLYS